MIPAPVEARGVIPDASAAEMHFGPGARRLAGLAGRILGWRPAEFWGATPAELIAVLVPEGRGSATAPLTRAELNRLMEAEDG